MTSRRSLQDGFGQDLNGPSDARPSDNTSSDDNSSDQSLLLNPSFAGLVVLAESLNPIPFRTRPLNSPAPMVLSLKTWKSRSLPGLPRTDFPSSRFLHFKKTPAAVRGCRCFFMRFVMRDVGRRYASAATLSVSVICHPHDLCIGHVDEPTASFGPSSRRLTGPQPCRLIKTTTKHRIASGLHFGGR